MSDIRLNSRMKSQSVTVGTTATAIPTTNLNSRTSMLVYNNGSETVYLGAQGVTVAQGFPLKAGQEKSFGCSEKFQLYGITEVGNVDVRVAEAY